MNSNKYVPYNLRRLRKNAGLTQKQLASVIGITQARISSIENGSSKEVTNDVLQKLAKGLVIAPEQLTLPPAESIILDSGEIDIESAGKEVKERLFVADKSVQAHISWILQIKKENSDMAKKLKAMEKIIGKDKN